MNPDLLDVVLATDALERRPPRPPDYKAENEALRGLLEAFSRRPEAGLQRLVEIAMTLCDAESAGLSVEDGATIRWWATAGAMKPLLGSELPRDESPCGLVMDRRAPLLFDRPERAYPACLAMEPRIEEALLTPFDSEGSPVGTLWVQNHGGGRPFDAEDRRILESLSSFASVAFGAEVARRSALADRVRYKALFESIDQGFCIIGMLFDDAGKPVDYRFHEVNAAFEAQTGLRVADVLDGKTILEMVPTHEPHWFEFYGRVAITGQPPRFEERAEGLGRWFEAQAFRIGGEGSPEVGVLFNDVTERRAASEALAAERARLIALLDQAPAFTALLEGPDLRFTFVSDEYRKLIGHRDVVGMSMRAALPELAGQGFFELVEGVLAGGGSYRGEEVSVQIQREISGPQEERRITFVYQAMCDADGMPYGVLSHGVDVTDAVVAREEIAEREELFRTVFESAPDDAIIVMDAARVIAAWNPAAERITGWAAADAVGQPADIIFTPEDRAKGTPNEEAGEAARDGKAEDERWHVRKDGSRFWGSGTMNSLHDAQGGVRGFLKVFRDATERRELEETLREAVDERTAELQHAMAEAEGFNYSIAHDLRAPLRAMASTSSILLEDLGFGLDAEHREMLVRQNENAKRMGRLIDELLRLSRLAAGRFAFGRPGACSPYRTKAWAST